MDLKRIIDGKTYNTATSTRLCARIYEGGAEYADSGSTMPIEESTRRGEILYRTRHGAFFTLCWDENPFHEPGHGDWLLYQVRPQTDAHAQAFLEACDKTDLIEQIFGDMPEAGSTEARITLRMPDSLKARIDARAKAERRTTNQWIVRCIELCLAPALKGTHAENLD